MSRALVVFESMFGNSEVIARAVAAGLAETMTVDIQRAGPDVVVGDVDLLVVGGPTHAFSMSRPATRSSAGQQGAPEPLAAGPGLREWLTRLELSARRPLVATFDTRIRKRGVPGSAARSAAKRLRQRGLRMPVPPASFWVADVRGPLLPDEVDRARRWGADLASSLAQPAGSR